MERTKQKAKKEKPSKYVDKEKSPSFVADVKTLKENLKIREILRTVKMNSSMRIKAPRGSKVMQNKDFNDNDDFEEINSNVDQDSSEPPSATNSLVVNNNADVLDQSPEESANSTDNLDPEPNAGDQNVSTHINVIETNLLHKSKSLSEGLEETGRQTTSDEDNSVLPAQASQESPLLRARDRKLSLDHTMLSKREGLSQSEVDLNSIGKSPLERKSSFFRKKMDSFLKNTTEIFKRQSSSLGSKSSRVERKGSTCSRMSVSMQSLNENEVYNGEYDGEALDTYNEELRGSVTSLRSSVTPVRSNSIASVSQSDRIPYQSEDSLAGSRPMLDGSQTLPDLSENYTQESFLHSRAISMSSGLDTAHEPRRRKTSRANRVTWVASESLTDYFRRLIQDEKTKEMQVCHSYQDFSTIPENNPYGTLKTDSKGRRLSYQRAVSGEDPVLPTRYQDNSFRRRKTSNTSEIQEDCADIHGMSQQTLSRLAHKVAISLAAKSSRYINMPSNMTEEVNAIRKFEAICGFRGITAAIDCTHIKIRKVGGDVGQYHVNRKGHYSINTQLEKSQDSEHPAMDQGLFEKPQEVEATAPVLPATSQDNESSASVLGPNELSRCLAEFSRSGVPTLVGFQARTISEEARAYLAWAEIESNLQNHYDCRNLPHIEEARQAAIREFMQTEADYIRHLSHIVDVYIAAAHALQDRDMLLELDTSRLFLNIPDVLNANLHFWETVIYPMIADAKKYNTSFNAELLAPGFDQITEMFEPYEEYVCHQSKSVDYLRAVVSNPDINIFLTWCNAQDPINRLQLSDLLVKPMQRLTKYGILIQRIAKYTEAPDTKRTLEQMEALANKYGYQVNRAIRQKEELTKVEELEKNLEPYEMDFKDDEQNRYFRLYNDVNLKCPMVNCNPDMWRSIIYEGDVRYKDANKEVEVRAILFTDMLLICKKVGKGTYKMIRPKITIERTVPFYRFNNRNNVNEVSGLIFVLLNDHGAAVSTFVLSEPAKDPNPQQTIRTWDLKIREAKVTYELSMWFSKNPVKDLAEVEADYTTEVYRKSYPDDWLIERKARERVAAMMHPNRKPAIGDASGPAEILEPGRGPPSLRHPLNQASTESSRNSRLSSFQQSNSAASHEDPCNSVRFLYRNTNSFEYAIAPQNLDEIARSITVNVVSDNECETVVPSRENTPPVLLVLQQPSPMNSPSPRSASAGGSQNTLRVSPQLSFVHSLPDLSVEQAIPQKPPPPVNHQSASQKLYRSHQELLQNRLAASQHPQYLTPDHRGTSYPPPSPGRASLKRGLAFSYSFKNPPLSKMGHVYSQSQLQADQAQASTSQAKAPAVPQPPAPEPTPSTSKEKPEKKKIMGNKSSSKSSSPEPAKEEENVTQATAVSEEASKKPTKPTKNGGTKKKSSRQNK